MISVVKWGLTDKVRSFGTAYLYADKSAKSAVNFMKRTVCLFKALS